VNLAQRPQQWAEPGQTVLSESTYAALGKSVEADRLDPPAVKGCQALVSAYRMLADATRHWPKSAWGRG
jgi:class 3 adenylate cyclase